MAKSFGDTEGSAVKNKLDYIKFEFGENKMRMVGDIIPRYSYWKKLNTNNIPIECLSFDREEERFLNIEKDWYKHYFPKNDQGKPMHCTWSYVGMVIDPKDNKLKLCGFKKKLYEQIEALAKKRLGDPTDLENGWWIIFDKNKTGDHRFNVEYVLDQLACQESKGPLSKEQLELLEEMPDIDELVPRPTADQQKAFIENAWINKEEENVDKDAVAAVTEDDDDIPF